MNFKNETLLTHVSERDIDLLMLEEFSCSKYFVPWFLQQITGEKNNNSITVVRVMHSVSGLGKGVGETDLLVDIQILENPNKIIRLLIENKIDSGFMPKQIERYKIRAAEYINKKECDRCFCILIAPKQYLESVYTTLPDSARFDSAIAYEKIIHFFVFMAKNDTLPVEIKKRYAHRAKVVNYAINKCSRGWLPVHSDSTADFRKLYHDFVRKQYPSLSIKNPSNTEVPKESKFIKIDSRDLNGLKGMPDYCLRHKIRHSKMDLEFKGYGASIDLIKPLLAPILEPDMHCILTGKSLSISIPTREIDQTKPFDEEKQKVNDALSKAVRIVDWMVKNSEKVFRILKVKSS